MNKETTIKMAHQLVLVKRTLMLQNDCLNTVPSVEKLSKDNALIQYEYLERALDNMFGLNQELIDQLEETAGYLYDLSDEMEDKQDDGSN